MPTETATETAIDHPCPTDGEHRLASRRGSCDVCNRAAQSIMRRARAELATRHADEYEELYQLELGLEVDRRAAAAS